MTFDSDERSDDRELGPAEYTASEQSLADALFTEHYDELMRIARGKRRRSDANLTLSTIDLLHESFLKLRRSDEWVDDEHFLRSAVLAMRHVLCDYARRKMTAKRQAAGTVPIEEVEPVLPEYSETPEQLVAIAELMGGLADANPRWARVVDARYFSGLTEDETAELLEVSVRTARRDWQGARRWLAEQLSD